MSFGAKTSSLQAYHMLVYRKAIHPEFFGIERRKRIVHGDYEFEAWVFKGGHTFLFQFEGLCISEIVTERIVGLPERAQVAAFPCAGERDFEEEVADRVEFTTSMQTETLSDHLYMATYKELLEHGSDCDGLMVGWEESGETLPSLSLIDTQRYHDEVHVQAYHLRGDCGLVLRTQTIFRAIDPADATQKDKEAAPAETAAG